MLQVYYRTGKVLCLLLLCCFSQNTFSQNWYVNDNSQAGDVFTSAVGNDVNPGTATLPLLTIDTAIARANPGDTIYVDAGDYVDDSVYVIKPLTLRGAKYGVPAGPAAVPPNRGVNETFLQGGIFVGPSIDDVTIDGFHITVLPPSNLGIVGRGLNCRIINNMTTATLNIFVFQMGIATRANGPLRLHSYEIKNNNVQGSRYGIYMDGNLELSSEIFDNYVTGCFQSAILLTASNGHHILGNVLEANVQGFMVEEGENLFERNTVRNNLTNGVRLAGNPLLYGNTFINNFFENNGIAINLTEDDAAAVNNSAHYNSFTGNGTDILSSHSAMFNATCNWFGTTDPLTIAAGISGNVLFTPFLIDGTDTDPVTSGFQPITACIVVPVNISSFTGHWVNKNVELNWVTQTESNNRMFEVQRSTDGQNYSVIGYVPGAGTSNMVRTYQFKDLDAVHHAGYLHYRLRQVDFDGNFSYSEVVMLKNENSAIFTIYPNPATDVLNIRLTTPNSAVSKYELYNHIGQKVQSGNMSNQLLTISVKGLPAGTYLVTLRDDNGEIIAKSLTLIR